MAKVIANTPKSRVFVGLIFFVIGLLAFFSGRLATSAGQNYATTTGVVKDYYMNYNSDGDIVYAEIARFEVDGRWYEAVSKSKSSTPRVIGSSVQVKYDPKNPNNSYVYRKIDDYIGIIVGGIFGVIGVVMVVSGVKGYVGGGNEKENNRRSIV